MKNFLLAFLVSATGVPALAQTPVPGAGTRRDINNLTVEGIPALPADLLVRVEQYQNVRSAAVAD